VAKRLTAFLLCLYLILGTTLPAGAQEPVDALRSNTTITVNGTRSPLRAYDISGRVYVDIFEIAIALSGTENQFALMWRDRNTSLHIISDVPLSAIGFNMSRRIANAATATPADINVLLDGDEVSISAYSITGEVYFNIRDIAAVLDFSIDWDTAEGVFGINTSQSFSESVVTRGIDPSKPMIALTFDDGPSIYTPPILDALEQYGAVATFYVTGNRVQRNRDIVIRAFEMGNEIANHSWSHRMLTRLSEERVRQEMITTNDAIESVTGTPPSNMRPPYGSVNQTVRNVTAELGMPIISWSLDPFDWRTRNANTTYNHIMNNVKDRDIILLHDLSEPTAVAAARLIPALIDRGFQLVTVSELFHYSGITPEPGVTYRSGVTDD